MKKVVIIGNGISGITAARHIRKRSNYDITVISAESEHFWSRTALMYIYMGHMKYEHTKPYEDSFWKKNNISLIHDYVHTIDFDSKTLSLQSNAPVHYDSLILATGSKPNKFNWPGQDLEGVCTMVSLQDLENIEKQSKDARKAVVVGGGLIGVEMAEMLRSRNIDTTFLVREKHFWGGILPQKEGSLIENHIREHHVNLLLGTELKEIKSDNSGKVKSLITLEGKEIECDFVGLAVGVHPNLDLVKNTALKTNKGILVNEYLETNLPDVYAVGDCAERIEPLTDRPPVEQVWYTGRMMGEAVAATICGSKTAYQPGPWFNSAKFFDVEYQTYGQVKNLLKEGETDFYWQHDTKHLAMHFVFDQQSEKFLGVNTFGIRLRHEYFDRWLKSGKSIRFVLENLREANFDPEFYSSYEEEIISAFNQQHPQLAVSVTKRKKILGLF
ncbi:NAD(P)/FAD-dependent oxidoreductase [Fulvivirga ligni]|uniref:NAD(P)/FAD-dependent oxidoreductase n=1 Tax=Fulvivirga ligni TaxID=2904246 RepID=UPI001F32927C|nr:FAD-dependent oxidoreductase [Fulvivirga ligni]UII21737.1 FAD-dependent oxidoreductase [Fulvivirga ligni]